MVKFNSLTGYKRTLIKAAILVENIHDVAEFGSGFNVENFDEFSGVQGVRE